MSHNPPEDDHQLDELRHLLLGPELKKLDKVTQHLENPEQFSSDIGEVLPQAMLKSAKQGEQLSEAMVPTVEEIVRLSIKRDINKFANALFPVIGPAIRKSISETIRQMLQSLNQVLEHGLSWKGIKWRIESIRTGIPFAQIVMLNSLEYRVEQVFLIHRKTGILLNHVEQENALNQNADMVSSMLTAIGDFVGDSFDVDNQQGLDNIQVGDFSIFINQGPDTILAVASRGNAPSSLGDTMSQVLEDIQSQFDTQLENFKGNTTPFENSNEQLLLCLVQSQSHTKNKRLSLKAKLLWVIAIILFFYWMVAKIYLSIQQHDYVDLLEQEPGFIITDVLYEDDKLILKGLRDPLARNAENFIALTTLNPDDVILQFDPYQSLDKPFVEKRLLKILNLPENVSMQLQARQLTVKGYASKEKINAINIMAPLIAGIDQVNSSELFSTINLSSLNPPKTVELELDKNTGTLISRGSALNSWREFAKQQASAMPGIRHYNDSELTDIFDLSVFNPPDSASMSLQNKVLTITGEANSEWIQTAKASIDIYDEINEVDTSQLQNSDEIQLHKDIQSLQQEMIFFDAALSFNFNANDSFNRSALLVNRIIRNANNLSLPVKITIRGYSDSVGKFEDNVFLSRERADYVAQYLFNTGISPKYILIEGLEAPVSKEKNASEQSYNRRVTFNVQLQ